MLLPSANPFKSDEEVLSLQPMIPSKRFDIFPHDWGMLRGSRCVQIFLSTMIPYNGKGLKFCIYFQTMIIIVENKYSYKSI